MPLAPALQEALDRARRGDVQGALDLLLGEEAPEPDENVQGFVFMLLKARGDLDEALRLADGCTAGAADDFARSVWLLRRGLLHLDRDDKMRAMVDLNHVLRLAVTPDHTEQARRALARTLDPDPVLPRGGPPKGQRYRG